MIFQFAEAQWLFLLLLLPLLFWLKGRAGRSAAIRWSSLNRSGGFRMLAPGSPAARWRFRQCYPLRQDNSKVFFWSGIESGLVS